MKKPILKLKTIEFGGIIINNVEASVSKNLEAPLLLGQNVLQKFGKVTIDNKNNILILEKH